MKDFFNRLEQQLDINLPFVAYRKPNKNTIKAILQNDDTLYTVNNFKETGFVFSPFDDREATVLLPLENSEVLSVSDDAVFHIDDEDIQKSSKFLTADKAFHIDLVKKGVKAIEDGQLQKVVLSRKEEVQLKETAPLSIFKNLLANYTSAFVYAWYHPKVGLWLGATPETLLKIEGRQFSMMSLAGTQNYRGSTDVVWKPKELQEQQFVTDFILDSIKSTVDNIKVADTETVKAGNLLHLRTQIKGILNPETLNFKSLLRSLHPTPAVCGLPKAIAKQFILEHENYHREFYTGFLGELNFEVEVKPRTGRLNIENRAYTMNRTCTQLYVNLRCMQIRNSNAMIYVGGGITESSNPESEWAETVSKSMVIKKVL